jgi:predicted kinase
MILVAGPPCAGKTTYARQYAKPGESVLDYGDIIEEMTGDRYSENRRARDAALDEWRRRLPISDWVIWTAPKREQRGAIRERYNARVLVMLTPMEECLSRARLQRPAQWSTWIREWFRDYEPSTSGGDEVIGDGIQSILVEGMT